MKQLYLFLIVCFTVSCSSPKSLYKKGKYNQSYKKALKALNKGSKKREDRDVLEKAYRKLNQLDLTEIELTLASNELDQWENAWEIYNGIEIRYFNSNKYLAHSNDADFEKYMAQKENLSQDLYSEYKLLGEEKYYSYAESYNKYLLQDAYYLLDKASFYAASEDLELEKMIDVCLENGVITYSINLTHFDMQFDWQLNNAFRNIEQQSSLFQKFEYRRGTIGDCHININLQPLRFNDFNSSFDQNYSERIQEGFETVTDTSGVTTQIPLYINVQGTVRTNRVTRDWEWQGNLNASSNANVCRISNNYLRATFRETIERYETFGDLRAIPAQYQNNYNNSSFNRESEVAEILASDLKDDLIRAFN